ncbi:hypothetical protein [Maridesulfovibrio sp.]|uniref:hypothetical protein n=1 Tax=Maridesulfovibrio sp. TaxID=2795000 RepID=UPI0039F0B619
MLLQYPHILISFSARIKTLHETVHSKSTSGIKTIQHNQDPIRNQKASAVLSSVIFSKDWQEASCHINADAGCIECACKKQSYLKTD